MRLAEGADRALLLEWVEEFATEVLHESMTDDAGRLERSVDARLAGGDAGFALWEVDGRSVSLVGFGGPTPNGIRIGPVYTPPDTRSRLRERVTAEDSAQQLARGRRFCFLYTDLGNPTLNAIYVRIGDERVCDSRRAGASAAPAVDSQRPERQARAVRHLERYAEPPSSSARGSVPASASSRVAAGARAAGACRRGGRLARRGRRRRLLLRRRPPAASPRDPCGRRAARPDTRLARGGGALERGRGVRLHMRRRRPESVPQRGPGSRRASGAAPAAEDEPGPDPPPRARLDGDRLSDGGVANRYSGLPTSSACGRRSPPSRASMRQTPSRRGGRTSTRSRRVPTALDSSRLDAVRFTGPGTELEIGLLGAARWKTAQSTTSWGQDHVTNLPTEEVFTTPDRARTEGVVRLTAPLHWYGSVVEGGELRFEDGRVVEVRAEVGEEFLRSKVAADEGASRVGEVALVDSASAVGRRGLVFRSLLFDENASSHIALGGGYTDPIDGASEMSDDERIAAGINSSTIRTST